MSIVECLGDGSCNLGGCVVCDARELRFAEHVAGRWLSSVAVGFGDWYRFCGDNAATLARGVPYRLGFLPVVLPAVLSVASRVNAYREVSA